MTIFDRRSRGVRSFRPRKVDVDGDGSIQSDEFVSWARKVPCCIDIFGGLCDHAAAGMAAAVGACAVAGGGDPCPAPARRTPAASDAAAVEATARASASATRAAAASTSRSEHRDPERTPDPHIELL